jgi:hypothetical protein
LEVSESSTSLTGESHAYATDADASCWRFERQGEVVRFLAYTGLRWGEMAALRVQDFDMSGVV